MPYKVLLIIKDKWWSDQKSLPTYKAATQHRALTARRWNDCETAILAPDGRVLAYQESQKYQAEIRALRATPAAS